MSLCLVNSNNTGALAREYGVAAEKIRVVFPGVDASPNLRESGANEFRRKHSLDGALLMLSVGRLTDRKGLIEFVEHALPGIVATFPEASLVVIGDEASDALKGSSGMRQRIEQLAARLGLAANIVMLGTVDERELEDAYIASDVHVFPVKSMPGDVEGFGMVAIEAAAHGLPTVAFAVGGVPDAVADGRSGMLVSPGNFGHFTGAVIACLETGRQRYEIPSRDFAANFGWERFGREVSVALIDREQTNE
jgi:phosphatidyl-myo-inositol dimannoside synthase